MSMTTCTTTQPAWYSLSHHDRYRRLQEVRHNYCQRPVRENEDVLGRTVYLDGRWINDVPSFYLSIGEAVNGPNGYFGGDLDALSDCFCGGFGVFPPMTIRLSHFDEVRQALDGRAWCRFHAEDCRPPSPEELLEDLKDSIAAGYLDDMSNLNNIEDFVDAAYIDAAYREQIENCVDSGYFGDGSPADIARWTTMYEAALAGDPLDCDEYGSYFEGILSVVKKYGQLVPDDEKARE